MTNVNDLKTIPTGPQTMEEWLDNFTPEDRAIVEDAILTRPLVALMPILTELDDNPFPFRKNTLSAWRSRYKDSNRG